MIRSYFFLTIFATSILSAQTFTAVTNGDIVGDTGRSGSGSWGDVNNDGWLDLFVANGNQSSQNNRLYLNNGDGTFTVVTDDPLVSNGGSSIGGAFGDLDGDGWLDIYVTNRGIGNNFLYRNNQDGSFTRITSGPPVSDDGDSNHSYWLDLDNDSNLDLFVLNFNQGNFFYENNGDTTLSRIDEGVLVTTAGFSITGAWGDYDDDGDLDYFMANGGSANDILFTNNGDGSFVTTILNDGRASLGASWGDYDNDGDLDLFVSCFLGQNNILWQNDGAPTYTFTRVTTGAIVNDGGNSVGSAWGDFDKDGDLDIFIGNDGQNNLLYSNNGDGTFTRMTSGPVVSDGGQTFGVSSADFDNDGDLDLFAANRLDTKNSLYTNDGNQNHWLSVAGTGVASNRLGIGLRIRAKADLGNGTVWQTREIQPQSGYNSQDGFRAFFGLAGAAVVDSLILRWPSGTVDILTDVMVNQHLNVPEGDFATAVERSLAQPTDFSLQQNYPNPFNPTTNIEFQLDTSGTVRLRIFNLKGQTVRTLVKSFFPAGMHSVAWDGRNDRGQDMPSGIYLYRLTAGTKALSRRMLLMK